MSRLPILQCSSTPYKEHVTAEPSLSDLALRTRFYKPNKPAKPAECYVNFNCATPERFHDISNDDIVILAGIILQPDRPSQRFRLGYLIFHFASVVITPSTIMSEISSPENPRISLYTNSLCSPMHGAGRVILHGVLDRR